MRAPQGLAAFFAAAAVVVAPSAGRAAERFSLAWDAPSECPNEAAVRAAVHRWLDLAPDMPPDRLDTAAVEATARIGRVDARGSEGSGQGWQLHLTLVSRSGRQEETLVTERCDSIVELVALKVALAADPAGFARSLADRARPGGPETPSPPPPALALRAVSGIGAGVLPGTAVAIAAIASYGSDSWRVEAGGQYWFARPATYAELPAVGAQIGLLAGLARACLLPTLGRVVLPICAGIELGEMHGTGFGVDQTKTSDQIWAAMTFGPALRWRVVGPVALWLEGDALVALNRPQFHMRNLSLLYEPQPAAAQAWTGLEVRFE